MNKILLGAVLLTATSARCDNLMTTKDPETPPAGMVKVETSDVYTARGDKTTNSVNLKAKYGLNKTTEVAIEGSYLNTNKNQSGLSDSTLSLKHRLYNKDGKRVSVAASTTLPTGNESFQRDYSPSVTLIGGWRMGKNDLMANVGYGRPDLGSRRTDSLSTGLALKRYFSKTDSGFVEVYSKDNKDFKGQSFVATGWHHALGSHATLDLRVGKELSEVNGKNYFGGIGLTIKR